MMTIDDLCEVLNEDADERYPTFPLVTGAARLSERPDLCAFLLLERLLPGQTRDLVAVAAHEQIWLGVDPEDLANVITHEDAVTLRRCGVWMDDETDSLTMYV